MRLPPFPNADPRANAVFVHEDMLEIHFVDGRELYVPIKYFAHIARAQPYELTDCRVTHKGRSIWWQRLQQSIDVIDALYPAQKTEA